MIPNVISPPGGSGTSTTCFDNFGHYFAYIKISTYRNYSAGTIDITYEVQYNYDAGFKAGYNGFSYCDLLACNYSPTVLRTTSPSVNSSVTIVKNATYGIGVQIKSGSTYARVIITGKPIGYTISNLDGFANMTFDHKINGLPSNVSFSISGNIIGISYTPTTYMEFIKEVYF